MITALFISSNHSLSQLFYHLYSASTLAMHTQFISGMLSFLYHMDFMNFSKINSKPFFTVLKCKPQKCNWKVPTDGQICISLQILSSSCTPSSRASRTGDYLEVIQFLDWFADKSHGDLGQPSLLWHLVMRKRPQLTAAFSPRKSQQSKWIASLLSHAHSDPWAFSPSSPSASYSKKCATPSAHLSFLLLSAFLMFGHFLHQVLHCSSFYAPNPILQDSNRSPHNWHTESGA